MSRRFPFWLVLVLGAFAQFAVWASSGRPIHPADVPDAVAGLAFSPYERDGSPSTTPELDPAALTRDLELAASHARYIRTYGASGPLEGVATEAAKHDLTVMLGIWVDRDRNYTETEINAAVRVANANSNVERITVGNEALHREDLSPAQLITDMERVRRQVSVPVGTAEPWHVWLAYPELAAASDFIGVHILPYWEGVPATEAIAYVDWRLGQLRDAFPGKPIVLAEVGWPSDGARIGRAAATPRNQARVVRDFVAYAMRTDLTDYFVVEAFDQPWKANVEGLAGAYWGLFGADREAKFNWRGEVSDRASWPLWAALATLLGLLPVVVARRLRPQLRAFPTIALTTLGQVMGGMLAVSILIAVERYMDADSWAVWGVLFGFQILLLLVLMVEMIEAAALSSRTRENPVVPASFRWPKVSIHVPCCNEPPSLVEETLRALAQLDYPDFEIIVIDNNTAERAVSDAIAGMCRSYGPRFRFLHLAHCPGYKAGALNRALAATDPAADVIAVVDADYVVDPKWLKTAMPYFSAPEVGLVQAPQDYRDAHESAFKTACYWEYRAFFRLGMVFRSDDDAIIQHGTMTAVRLSALREAGGWDENCITEDAELGLRLYAQGWKSVYLEETLGRGIMPDDSGAYGRQRYRWAFGAMQILRRHCKVMFGRTRSQLTMQQRYHFFAGWLPWVGDGIGLVMALGSIVWAATAAMWPAYFEPPQAHFLLPVLAVFALRHVRLWWLYDRYVRATRMQRSAAMLAGVSLAHSVARAILSSLFRANSPFRRTPKACAAPKLAHSLATAHQEAILFTAFAAAALVLIVSQDLARLDVQLWLGVLATQAWPYAAALVIACQAARRGAPETWPSPDVQIPLNAAEIRARSD